MGDLLLRDDRGGYVNVHMDQCIAFVQSGQKRRDAGGFIRTRVLNIATFVKAQYSEWLTRALLSRYRLV
jgi:hypothetical protein